MDKIRQYALEDLHTGNKVKDIAVRYRVTEHTIFNWKKKYDGKKGYGDRPRPR